MSEEVRIKAEELVALAVGSPTRGKNPKLKNKLYSLHDQNLDCISKGKTRQRYELGTKVAIACTQKEGFVVGMRSYSGNPYVGHMKNDGLLERCHLRDTE